MRETYSHFKTSPGFTLSAMRSMLQLDATGSTAGSNEVTKKLTRRELEVDFLFKLALSGADIDWTKKSEPSRLILMETPAPPFVGTGSKNA
jgi:hypothetical protein